MTELNAELEAARKRQELQTMVRKAIGERVDHEQWERRLEGERQQRGALEHSAKNFRWRAKQ